MKKSRKAKAPRSPSIGQPFSLLFACLKFNINKDLIQRTSNQSRCKQKEIKFQNILDSIPSSCFSRREFYSERHLISPSLHSIINALLLILIVCWWPPKLDCDSLSWLKQTCNLVDYPSRKCLCSNQSVSGSMRCCSALPHLPSSGTTLVSWWPSSRPPHEYAVMPLTICIHNYQRHCQ